MKFYNQVFSDLSRGIHPKSRQSILQDFFRKYVPLLANKYPENISDFITGDLSYEEMLSIFTRDFFTGNTHDAVIYFLEAYSPGYSCGESELPAIRRTPYLRDELSRFIEVFGPYHKPSGVSVSGTVSRINPKISDILEPTDFLF